MTNKFIFQENMTEMTSRLDTAVMRATWTEEWETKEMMTMGIVPRKSIAEIVQHSPHISCMSWKEHLKSPTTLMCTAEKNWH